MGRLWSDLGPIKTEPGFDILKKEVTDNRTLKHEIKTLYRKRIKKIKKNEVSAGELENYLTLALFKVLEKENEFDFFLAPFLTHMTSDLVSKILLTLVTKIFLFIFVIFIYRPTLLTTWFDIWRLDNFDWQLDPLLCCVSIFLQYWNAAYTEACLHSNRAMKWTEWMYRVWYAVFSLYIYFLDLSISFIFHVSYI